jgi:hypothetical protein
MSHDASGDVRLPRVGDLHPDVATMMIARAFAEIYRDVLEEPVPEQLAAILRRMDRRGGRS